MRVYNLNTRDDKVRFLLCIVVGVLASFILGIAYGLLHTIIHVEFEYIYLLIGYAIAMLLQKIGRGVTRKYNYLGALLCIFAIMVGDISAQFGIDNILTALTNMQLLSWFIQVQLQSFRSMWGLIALMIRVAGVYVAYMKSSVL